MPVDQPPQWARALKGQIEEVVSDQRQVRKMLEEHGSKPASGSSPASTFAGFIPSGSTPSWDNPALQQQLKRLQPYDRSAVDMMMRMKSRDGRVRLSGCGPALAKFAALKSGRNDEMEIVRAQGIMPQNYGFEQLEKEHQIQSYSSWVTKGLTGEVRKAALAEASGTTGGYVIPPQFMSELLTIAAEDGFIEPRAKIIPMNARSVEWPMLDITTAQSAGVSPYFGGIVGYWQPEAATINETEPAFRQSQWTAWDLVLYTVSSNQLLADNGIGLDALLTQLFGQAMVWYKEYAYLQGRGAGSSMPLGILNAPATLSQTRAIAGHFVLQDAAAMLSHLQIRSWEDACWMAHQSVIPELIQMQDAATTTAQVGSQVAGIHMAWMTPYGDGKTGGVAQKLPQVFLNGLPLFFTEKLPKLGTNGCVALADWSRYVIGMRLDFQIDVSPHLLFRSNQLAWRVICRCDAKPWLNAPITDASGWQVSPFIAVTQ